MGQLTTHVLDTSAGLPAAGIRIDLHALEPQRSDRLLGSWQTGGDGRCPMPLLAGAALVAGRYALTFHVAEYYRGRGLVLPVPPFIEAAVVRIGIADPAQHYHVPLLVTPWGYTTYRGG
jgi:5-hydroxyisourate hydrolase